MPQVEVEFYEKGHSTSCKSATCDGTTNSNLVDLSSQRFKYEGKFSIMCMINGYIRHISLVLSFTKKIPLSCG